jgi:uncharacterized protein YgbK (DUF1537 family)
MTTLRLIADDLTGALDTAAAFVGVTGPVPVFWSGRLPDPIPQSAAFDCASRECDRDEAASRHTDLAGGLVLGDIAFKKIDSLLRGHAVAEIAALMRSGGWTHAVLAPAFPYQGRITRHGRQYRSEGDSWVPVCGDLVTSLLAEGVAAQLGDPSIPGVTVMNAESDAALDAIVRECLRCQSNTLWCGSAGLADALVRVLQPGAGLAASPIRKPVLGIFGSDQDVTARQLDLCAGVTVQIGSDIEAGIADIASHLAEHGAAMVRFDLPQNTSRAEAAETIRDRLVALLPRLSPPGTLVVAGGETLREICDLVGASHLQVTDALEPGVPRSTLHGGAWDGVDIISKSGAFGGPHWLRDLLHDAGIALKG